MTGKLIDALLLSAIVASARSYAVILNPAEDLYEPVPQNCPATVGNNPTYFAAVNCSKFWQCSNEGPQLFLCPANLEFDPVDHVCRDPTLAKCTGQGWAPAAASSPIPVSNSTGAPVTPPIIGSTNSTDHTTSTSGTTAQTSPTTPVTTPAPGTTPSVTTPAPGTTPSVTTPAPGTTPSVTTPAPGTTPSVTVPAPGTTPGHHHKHSSESCDSSHSSRSHSSHSCDSNSDSSDCSSSSSSSSESHSSKSKSKSSSSCNSSCSQHRKRPRDHDRCQCRHHHHNKSSEEKRDVIDIEDFYRRLSQKAKLAK